MGLCTTKASVAGDDGHPLREASVGGSSRAHGFRSQLVRHERVHDIYEMYEIRELLGAGMSGSVHVVVDRKTGERYAMKTVNRNRVQADLMGDLMNEINVLKQMDHPGIIKLVRTAEDKRRIYLVGVARRRGSQRTGRLRARAGVHAHTRTCCVRR